LRGRFSKVQKLDRGVSDAGVWTFRRFAQMRRGAGCVATVAQRLSESQMSLEMIRRMFDGFSQTALGLRGVAASREGYGVRQVGVRERRGASDGRLEVILSLLKTATASQKVRQI
jgi:hypothetical protein